MTKVILTGATGTAGSEILRVLLLHPAITKVAVLSRRELPPHIIPAELQAAAEAKVTLVIHKDFSEYPDEILSQLKGYDACVWAQGIMPRMGITEEEVIDVSYEWPAAGAKAFSTLKESTSAAKFVFVYVSGARVSQVEGKSNGIGNIAKHKAGKLAGMESKGEPGDGNVVTSEELKALAKQSVVPA
ncbi:hypothetical protein RQP46_001199 [Phenoliferia psychrophenolica]